MHVTTEIINIIADLWVSWYSVAIYFSIFKTPAENKRLQIALNAVDEDIGCYIRFCLRATYDRPEDRGSWGL